jgi:hypothetical protein
MVGAFDAVRSTAVVPARADDATRVMPAATPIARTILFAVQQFTTNLLFSMVAEHAMNGFLFHALRGGPGTPRPKFALT